MEKLFQLFYQTSGVCTDTRNITNNSLFIALKGDNFNGNEFAEQAITSGAKYSIVDEEDKANNSTIFYVEDSLVFLQKLALFHRRKMNIPIIGITGSNGKTTSKELISTVLAKKYKVLFTKGNLNNHIGVPLTLLNLTDEHEIAVIEMGANKPGDIQELCEIAEPNYGIITNIGRAHLEGFGNLEGVIQTKTALYRSLEKNNGIIIANADDETICAKIPSQLEQYFYSETKKVDIQGKLIGQNPFVSFSWNSKDYSSPIVATQLVGKYNFYNFLAAVCFGNLFNVSPDKINEAIAEYHPTNNRSQIEKTLRNTLILDCYNANPTSVNAALESFDLMEAPNKTVILGDMLELGKESKQEHEKVVQFLKKKKWDIYLVGKNFMEFNPTEKIKFFTNSEELKSHLINNPINNQLILIKGSRGIKLEVVTKTL